jgi:hypothetical protein
MVGRKPGRFTIGRFGMTLSAQIGCSLFVPTSVEWPSKRIGQDGTKI